mgnify:FL=1
MPHTWWHQWDYLPDTQEPAADPTVFQEYLFPAARAAGSGIAQVPGVMPTLQGLGAGLNFVHGRVVQPFVNQAIETIPATWQLNEGVTEQSPWYRPISRFTEGRMVSNVDQYVTPKGKFSPAGAFDQFMNINPVGAVAGTVLEGLNIPEPWQAKTRRSEATDREVAQIERETGEIVSEQQRREIGQELYPTLPYARGIAEEAPYFAIPSAGAIRGAAAAARVGAAAANNPALRAGLRGVELGLTPIAAAERAAERTVTAPFRALGGRKSPTTQATPIDEAERIRQLEADDPRYDDGTRGDTAAARRSQAEIQEMDRPGGYMDQQYAEQQMQLPNAGRNIPVSVKTFEIEEGKNFRSANINRPGFEVRVKPTADQKLRMAIMDEPAPSPVPEQLYRIVDAAEYRRGLEYGYLDPRWNAEQRINASGKPWFSAVNNIDDTYLLAIKFDDADGWYTREIINFAKAGREVIAATDQRIPIEKVSVISSGNIKKVVNDFEALQAVDEIPVETIAANRYPINTTIPFAPNYGDIYEFGDQLNPRPRFDLDQPDVNRVPNQAEMKPEVYEQIKSEIPDDDGLFNVEKDISKGEVNATTNKLGSDGPNILARTIRALFPNTLGPTADSYLRGISKYWNQGEMIRQLANFRASLSGGLLAVKEFVNVADNLHRWADRAGQKANNRVINLYKSQILPELKKANVNLEVVNQYVMVKTLKNIKDAFNRKELARQKLAEESGKKFVPGKRENPNMQNPETGEFDIQITDDNLYQFDDRTWIKNTYNYTDEQVDAIEKMAKSVQTFYAEQRTRLANAGIISQEQLKHWEEFYDWYTPTEYIEFAGTQRYNVKPNLRDTSVLDDGVMALSNNIKTALGRRNPLDFDSLTLQAIRAEYRAESNKTTKTIVELLNYDADRQLLKDLTDIYIDEDGALLKAIPEPANGTGYFVYYENGKRKVFGGLGDNQPVPKDIWQEVNGRHGYLAVGENAFLAKIAASNGWFRSVFTTYSPLFWVRNAVIDMFTVQFRAGVTPDKVVGELGRSFNKILFNKEDNFVELMERLGGWSSGTQGYINLNSVQRRMIKEFRDAGQSDGAILITGGTNQIEKELKNSLTNQFKNFMPTVGGAFEAAPRLAVARKSFIKQLNELGINGKAEMNRLMKLSKEDFYKELTEEWKGGISGDTPKGLIDWDFAQRAADNSIDATLDFYKGGWQIRDWNNYILFLNAAAEGFKVPFRTLGIDLHPVVRPVKDPVPNGPLFEFGSVDEQIKKYAKSVNNGTVSPLTFGLGYREARGATGRGLKEVMGPKQASLYIGGAIYSYWAIQEGWNKQFEYEGKALYYDIPEYIRYNGLIFMLPPKRDEAGEHILDPVTQRPKPQYIVIPHRLREWNTVFGAVTFLSENSDEDANFSKAAWGKEVWKSTFPINELPMPEVFNVAGEQLTGFDTWRQSQIVEDEDAPLEEQYTRRTSKTIRELAGVIEELPVEDVPIGGELIDNIVSSPDRLNHLYDSVFGSVGQLVSDMADWTYQTFEELRGLEDRPMAQKVAEFRNMSRLDRAEFRLSLTPEEYEEFQKELKEPDKKQLPFIEGLKNSFYPERGGALLQAGRRRAEQTFPEISVKQTKQAGIVASKVRQELLFDQQKSDSKLLAWYEGNKKDGITPKEWREERSKKYLKYEGAKLGIGEVYEYSIQNAEDSIREAYYAKMYNDAGQIDDIRNKVDLLLAGYYEIKIDAENPDSANWDAFFNARNEYVEALRVNSETLNDGVYAAFSAELSRNDTATEKSYIKSSQYMKEYWDAGKDLSQLYPAAANNPQMSAIWNEYINGSTQDRYNLEKQYPYLKTLNTLRNNQRKQVVINDAREGGNLDFILAYWYGDFYRGVTPQAKAYHASLYGPPNVFMPTGVAVP